MYLINGYTQFFRESEITQKFCPIYTYFRLRYQIQIRENYTKQSLDPVHKMNLFNLFLKRWLECLQLSQR